MTYRTLFVIGVVLATACAASCEQGIKTASAACTTGGRGCIPDVSYIDTNGTAYTPQTLARKVVIVNFWATWCKPCLKEIPALSRYYTKHKDKGLEILGIMTDDPDYTELVEFQVAQGMTYPVVRASSDILISYQYPGALPTTFVYDRNGKQVYTHVGELTEAQLVRIVDPLLAQQ